MELLQHKALPPSPLPPFLVHPCSIQIAPQTLQIFCYSAKTVSEIPLVLTYKPYSDLRCSVGCRHASVCFWHYAALFYNAVILHFGVTFIFLKMYCDGQTKYWTAAGFRFRLCIGLQDCFSPEMLNLKEIIFVICLMKMHNSVETCHCFSECDL